MDEIMLVKPTIEYKDDIIKFRQEILEANDIDSFANSQNEGKRYE